MKTSESAFLQARICCSRKKIWMCIGLLMLVCVALDVSRFHENYLTEMVVKGRTYIVMRQR